jgi:hypothetical protein
MISPEPERCSDSPLLLGDASKIGAGDNANRDRGSCRGIGEAKQGPDNKGERRAASRSSVLALGCEWYTSDEGESDPLHGSRLVNSPVME